jgi:CheY-like chemotaxis protein
VWPQAHEATAKALSRHGWSPVPVRRLRDVAEQRGRHAAALLVDPMTGPVTKRSLIDVRNAAVTAKLPLLVAAGLGEAARGTLNTPDPAALIGALRPAGSLASRVLLVDEDQILAAAMAATLEQRGMQPVVAGSESEAMLRAAIAPPDLVLLDIGLSPSPRPGILDWLRAQGRLHETPVIAYTPPASPLGADRAARLRSGESTLFVQARSDAPGIDERIAELVLRLAAPYEPM